VKLVRLLMEPPVLFCDYANSLAPASFTISYKLERDTNLEKAPVTKVPRLEASR
jgi:hypothetical protein